MLDVKPSISIIGKRSLNHLVGVSELRRRIAYGIYHSWTSYGLRRDVTEDFTAPRAKVPVEVRPLVPADVRHLFCLPPQANPGDVAELRTRIALLKSGIPTCYVAVTEGGLPCYLQWLFTAQESDRVRRFFRGRFPRLAQGEALLENAYTPAPYRGLGIMPYAMATIAEAARDAGARTVRTFVDHENIASLKGCKRAGFLPHVIRRDTWLLVHLRRRFTLLPAGTPYPFDVPLSPRAF